MGLDAKIVDFTESSSIRGTRHRPVDIEVILRLPEKPVSYKFIRFLLRSIEVAVVGVPGLVAYLVLLQPTVSAVSLHYYSAIAIALLFSAALFQLLEVYSRESIFNRSLRLERVLMAWGITCCALIVLGFGLKISENYSRLWAGTWFVSSATLLVFVRTIFGMWVRRWSEEGRFADRTVIVGAGKQGLRLAEHGHGAKLGSTVG